MQTVREDNRIFPRLEPLWDDPLTAALATSSAPPPLKERFSGLRNAFVDGNDIVAEIEGGVVTATYLRSLNIDEPFMRTTSTGQAFYHTDALGSVLALTDQTGTVQTTYRYDPFGNTTVTGTSTNPFQYTGRENDGTGLMFYRARYYSPTLQRFLGEDPIGFESGFNLYTYVDNSPVNYVDWDGLTKGGDKNINVIHRGVELTSKTPVKQVQEAIKEAIQGGMSKAHIRGLRGVLKEAKKFAKFGLVVGIIVDELLDPSELLAGEEELWEKYIEKEKKKEKCTSGRKC